MRARARERERERESKREIYRNDINTEIQTCREREEREREGGSEREKAGHAAPPADL